MKRLVVSVALSGPPFCSSLGISNIFRPPIRLVTRVKVKMVLMLGRVMRKKVCARVAPSTSAAS